MTESTLVQNAYTTVIKHFIRTGRAPHCTELAETLGLQPDEAKDVQREAAQSELFLALQKLGRTGPFWQPNSCRVENGTVVLSK